jgi:hypothetical protein
MRGCFSWPQLIPFINAESVAHTCITPITYGDQIFDRRFTALAFWNVMACMEIECVNMVLAPCNRAFYFEYMTGFLHPVEDAAASPLLLTGTIGAMICENSLFTLNDFGREDMVSIFYSAVTLDVCYICV